MMTAGRILNMGENCAAMNMAVDEAVLISQKEHPNPTLRFYDWTHPAFSFGYFQDIASEVDVEACRVENIELVKRMTGGGTVVHGWDLTYTLVLPRHDAETSVSDMYKRIGNSLVNAFERLAIPAACYTATQQSESAQNICLTNPAEHDVMCDDKKLAGVSVRRNRYGILFQGYISLDIPPDPILKRVSKIPEIQEMLLENATAINTEGRCISRSALIKAISETFDVGVTFSAGELSIAEKAQAETLVHTKYAIPGWNFH
ncbi:lipoate--protein ligase family protein [Candidatus Poribacteria bacterium]|nr:lipoate--protein ligase family protein [Candidatus Poribacteria bacterium]MYB65816.1 lipoate--protein ligase family protein [Candidatus Poribacteria bacterium]MYF57042.1 lipoate--protein ligase family protein [Candidatus Poribacteria bacterium]MYI92932.1 lipoate--protein ligase family protein [Candidatus Poribacteria bacterium]